MKPGAIIRDVLEAIAAKTEAGACVTHVGPDGAGHFVKMVHNGIEYGDMQLIAESWDVLRRGLGMTRARNRRTSSRNGIDGPLASFLTELTAQVCRTIDRGDRAAARRCRPRQGRARRARASGRRRSRSISRSPSRRSRAAIDARVLSSHEGRARRRVAGAWPARRRRAGPGGARAVIDDLRDALYAARICAYAQGMALIRAGSEQVSAGTSISPRSARIWKGGCIIRARLLDPVRHAFASEPDLVNLLLDPAHRGGHAASAQAGWRRTVIARRRRGHPDARPRRPRSATSTRTARRACRRA